MNKLIRAYRAVELFFGNVKFAVVIISVFALYLGYGTFMESYHGVEYANRLVYKSAPFMGIQFLMFLSILFATLIRLPAKRHLYGFYTIHSGLIILFLGSFITYYAGVDGTLTLPPNQANRSIQINQDEFRIQFPSQGKEVTVDLPFVAGEKDLKLDYEGIKLKRFLPFAEDQQQWMPTKIADESHSSSRYRIYNDNFGEFITLSLHPQADYNNTLALGPLNVHYMPQSLAKCFESTTPDGLIIWNAETSQCLSPLPDDIKRTKNLAGKTIAQVQFLGERIAFLPDMSPLPLDSKMELNEQSPYRIFSKKLFEKGAHLFLFGKHVVYFNKELSLWQGHPVQVNGEVELPWMGFKVRLLEHRSDAYPTLTPSYTKPIQDNGQLIKGDLKAVEVEMDGQVFWVKSTEPISYNLGNEKVQFFLTKKEITLPYELVLDRFKMDTDPGTNNPASYESFVTLFRGNEGSQKHHVFMNNPLKYENFTFYQASYFQTQQGPYGSVLSVNYDPGRPWKYLGSLLLVLGSIWHYFLRRKHIQKPGAQHAQA
jgi:hypothetical protein